MWPISQDKLDYISWIIVFTQMLYIYIYYNNNIKKVSYYSHPCSRLFTLC